MDRIENYKEILKKLNKNEEKNNFDNEFYDIMNKFIYGDIYHVGNLTLGQRELINSAFLLLALPLVLQT